MLGYKLLEKKMVRYALIPSLMLLLIPLLAVAEERVEPPKVNEFFAFDNGVGHGKWSPQEQAKTLKELGYDGIGYFGIHQFAERYLAIDAQGLRVYNLYVMCDLTKKPAYSPQLIETIAQLKGKGVMIWLTAHGKTTDEEVALVIQEIADEADKFGVKVALYPHAGLHIATTEESLRLLKKIKRSNVGVTINLAHELKAGNAAKLVEIVKKAAPHLYFVSINGANRDGKTWEELIQPLGEGDFDMSPFLLQLSEVGYTGPIGLQCYNVKGDQRTNLKKSMAEWKRLSSTVFTN